MICSDKELNVLRSHRAALAQQLAQVDALIASATQHQNQNVEAAPQSAQKPVDPLVAQRLATAASADHIIMYWEKATGYRAPHNMVVHWITEHGKEAVTEVANAMLAKHSKTPMTGSYQYNYVGKVLRDQAARLRPATAGQIEI